MAAIPVRQSCGENDTAIPKAESLAWKTGCPGLTARNQLQAARAAAEAPAQAKECQHPAQAKECQHLRCRARGPAALGAARPRRGACRARRKSAETAPTRAGPRSRWAAAAGPIRASRRTTMRRAAAAWCAPATTPETSAPPAFPRTTAASTAAAAPAAPRRAPPRAPASTRPAAAPPAALFRRTSERAAAARC